jgi:putative MFS transporter
MQVSRREEPPSSGVRGSHGTGPPRHSVTVTVLVAALGYFVDLYDLILFFVVRIKSLRSLGVPPDELLDTGVMLIDAQMIGMLLGGVLWGVLGDKRGRLSVLLGSILLYSCANIVNAYVRTVPEYALLRFVAGVGLAGELGAGVTLVSEVMSREGRGWGPTLIAGIGLLGAITAALVGAVVPWQQAFLIGGGLGLALLLLRAAVRESDLFLDVRHGTSVRGSFWMLFQSRDRLRRYLAVIFVGTPIWFCLSVFVGLSPEFAKALGMSETPDPARSVLFFYCGASAGDLASGALSQVLRSRKKVLGLFLGMTALAIGAYVLIGPGSLALLYACCGFLGFATGYWAVFVTVAAELFGTNLRATTTTTAPNFVRGSVVPLTALFGALRGPLGVTGAALAVGGGALVIAVVALVYLDETFGKDLDYLES